MANGLQAAYVLDEYGNLERNSDQTQEKDLDSAESDRKSCNSHQLQLCTCSALAGGAWPRVRAASAYELEELFLR